MLPNWNHHFAECSAATQAYCIFLGPSCHALPTAYAELRCRCVGEVRAPAAGQQPPGLRSAASMFDELIDSPCGHTDGGTGLLHSRQSGSGEGFVEAGDALELGPAPVPLRAGGLGGRAAGPLSAASRLPGKKTLRIHEPHGAPFVGAMRPLYPVLVAPFSQPEELSQPDEAPQIGSHAQPLRLQHT